VLFGAAPPPFSAAASYSTTAAAAASDEQQEQQHQQHPAQQLQSALRHARVERLAPPGARPMSASISLPPPGAPAPPGPPPPPPPPPPGPPPLLPPVAAAALASSSSSSAAAALAPPKDASDAAHASDASGADCEDASSASASSSSSAAAASDRPRTPCQRASEVALGFVYALVLSLIAVVSWLISTRGEDRALVAWCISAFFVGLTVPLSLHDIHMHLLHFVSPLQRYYVRILFLVPIYAVESWFSLRYHHQSIYIATLRDLYEPFVVHAFYQLLVQFLGSREALARKLVAHKGAYANITLFPWGVGALRRFACAPPDRGGRLWCLFWRNGAPFLFRTQLGVYQYVFLKVVLTVGFFAASLNGTLGADDDYKHYNAYYAWIMLLSQMWAITCLVLLFEATIEWLRPLQPFLKFVSVKGMVFFAWMQMEFIGFLDARGYIYAYEDLSAHEVAEGLQNFCICIELLALGYMHHLSFSVRDFYEPGKGALLVPDDEREPRLVAAAAAAGGGASPGATPHKVASKAAHKIALHIVPGGDLGGEGATYARMAAKGVLNALHLRERGGGRKSNVGEPVGSGGEGAAAAAAGTGTGTPAAAAAGADEAAAVATGDVKLELGVGGGGGGTVPVASAAKDAAPR